MLRDMTSIAILSLLLLESFLAADMDRYTEPVLKGVRSLEKTALKYTKRILPSGLDTLPQKLTRFYLFASDFGSQEKTLDPENEDSLLYFNPRLDTKVIIHGFLDKARIADWMHHMKDEFLLLDDFNVILVDWSFGNFIPYTKAAKNTEQVGEEIAKLLRTLMSRRGARPEKFHLIGHSLGSHVAGYVGERVRGLSRITGLDPATYLFKDKSPRAKLDRTDAAFVDVVHTDGGGIGMSEPMGHVDFYPNGGQVQSGCTASNSLRTLLERGVVEGARSVICSHMRAPHLFTDSINGRSCEEIAFRCTSWEAFSRGQCDTCGNDGSDCAVMGYHADSERDYGNFSRYYLLTADRAPFCGYEYKILLTGVENGEWSGADVLHVSIYGSAGNAEFKIDGNAQGRFQRSRVVFSPSYLGDVMGAIIRWSRKPLTRSEGLRGVLNQAMQGSGRRPSIKSIHVNSLKTMDLYWRIDPIVFDLCVSPMLSVDSEQQGATFRNEYC